MADMNSRKAQGRSKKDYSKHVQFKPHFAAGDNIFIERSFLMASAADGMVLAGYFKLLPERTGPYGVISIHLEYSTLTEASIQILYQSAG